MNQLLDILNNFIQEIEDTIQLKNGVILLKDKVLFNHLMVLNLDQLLEWGMNQLLDILFNFIQATEDTLK